MSLLKLIEYRKALGGFIKSSASFAFRIFDRQSFEILAVKLQQIEGIETDWRASPCPCRSLGVIEKMIGLASSRATISPSMIASWTASLPIAAAILGNFLPRSIWFRDRIRVSIPPRNARARKPSNLIS